MQRPELTLEDLQQVSLDILKSFDRFCRANGLNYSLAYGTLLGAIRHKGFIPWDDDIDVFMLRPDYERLCRTFSYTGLELACLENRSDCLIAFARICDTRRTVAESLTPWIRDSRNLGVWIDVFPIDTVPDEPEEMDKTFRKAEELSSDLTRSRRALRKMFLKDQSLGFNLNTLKKRLFSLFQEKTEIKARRLSDFCTSLEWASTDHVSKIAYVENRQHFRLADFSSFTDVPFQDSIFMAASGYDNILRESYGDYMQLPPVEQRVPKQQHYIKFYWKEL